MAYDRVTYKDEVSGNYRARTDLQGLLNKLGEIEDYEENIKCPLSVILQVLEKGIIVKSDTTNSKIERWYPYQIQLVKDSHQLDICKISSRTNKYVGAFNYKKTWWLMGEEISKNDN